MTDGQERFIEQKRHINGGYRATGSKTDLSKVSFVAKVTESSKKFSTCLSTHKTPTILTKVVLKEEDRLPIYSIPGLLNPGCFAETKVCVEQKKEDTLSNYLTKFRINTNYPRSYNCLKTLCIFNSMQYLFTN